MVHSSLLLRSIFFVVLFFGLGHLLLQEVELEAFYQSIRSPSFDLPWWGWELLGVGYYLLCIWLIFRILLQAEPAFPLPFWLLMGVMATMEWMKYLLFAQRAFCPTFYGMLALSGLVVLFNWQLFRFSRLLGWTALPLSATVVAYMSPLAWHLCQSNF